MRVLITGSRTWYEKATICAALDQLHAAAGEDLTVVHGACPSGADSVADFWARWRGVKQERHPAEWSKHGRSAGPRRNAEMVNLGADLCLAFIRGASPGATGCARLAEKAGIPVTRYDYAGDDQ